MPSPYSKYLLTSLMLIVLSICCAPAPPIAAQGMPTPEERPDLYVTLEDGSQWYRIGSSGKLRPAHWFSAAYQYKMVNDSTSVTDYTITEFRKNGSRVALRNWKDKRTVNTSSDILDFNSRTVDVTLSTGDTLSFYRELYWFNPVENYQARDRYLSQDMLAFSVELVRTVDSTRIALVDSIGILPCPTACVPVVHGMLPIMANVYHVVPATLNGVEAFLRVRTYAQGPGNYFFTRKEQLVVGLSERLADPYWINYLTRWGQVFGKPALPDVNENTTPYLNVRMAQGSRSDIEIDFNLPPNTDGPVSVVIYDVAGNAMFYPFSTPIASHPHSTSYRFNKSGAYLIGLVHNNQVIAVKKISITI